MDSASWPLPQSLSWSTVYNAVIPHVSRFNPVLQDGGYMIVSKTVRNMATATDIASSTRAEIFKGEAHLYKTATNLENMFGDPVSSLTGTGGSSNRRSSAVSEPYEGLPTGMQSIIVSKDQKHSTDSRRQYTASTMIVDKPSSMRSMFFSPTLSTIYMIAGTDPLQNSVLDNKPVLRSMYSLSVSESGAKWALIFDGGPVAADIVQIQACTGIIDTNLDANNKGIVACSYTDRFSTLKLFRLAVGNRHTYSPLWQNASMPAPPRLRFTTELVAVPRNLNDPGTTGFPDMVMGIPAPPEALVNGTTTTATQYGARIVRFRISGPRASQYDYLSCATERCGAENFVSMAFTPLGQDLFAVDEQPSLWRWQKDESTPSGFSNRPTSLASYIHPLRSAVWKIMIWSNNRLVLVTDTSINLWTQCSPCPLGTVTSNSSSAEALSTRCICPSGTFNNLVDFRSRCSACTAPGKNSLIIISLHI